MLNRNSPTGGLAKGMPLNSRTPLRMAPRTAPLSVITVVGSADVEAACRGGTVQHSIKVAAATALSRLGEIELRKMTPCPLGRPPLAPASWELAKGPA
jgi:hypothetical protein